MIAKDDKGLGDYVTPDPTTNMDYTSGGLSIGLSLLLIAGAYLVYSLVGGRKPRV